MTYTITIRRADDIWREYHETVDGKRNMRLAVDRLSALLRQGDNMKVTDESGGFVESRWLTDREVAA